MELEQMFRSVGHLIQVAIFLSGNLRGDPLLQGRAVTRDPSPNHNSSCCPSVRAYVDAHILKTICLAVSVAY